MTIKRQLIILVLAAVLPILIFSAAMVGYITSQQAKSVEMSLQGNTRALSAAVDEQITAIKSSLSILAVVEDFDYSNLKDLHRRLRRFVKNQPEWSSIGLAQTDGSQIFSTLTDFGAPLKGWGDQFFFQELLLLGKPSVSGLRIGKVTGLPVFSVGVPVREKGKIKYVLVATVSTSLLSKMLIAQNYPSNWTAAIVDQSEIIIARSRSSEKYIGAKATSHLAQEIRLHDSSMYEDYNLEGNRTYGSFNKLKPLGWTVVLGIPFEESHTPFMKILWTIALGGGSLLMLGLILALIIGNRVANSVGRLSNAARDLGRGEKIQKVTSELTELNDVGEVLYKAALEREKSDAISKELYAKAQAAIELRDNFLSVASHELKTPLTTINLQAQLINRNMDKTNSIPPEKLRTSLNRMLAQLRRLTGLIDDLLDISRINAGRLEIKSEDADLAEIVRDIVSNFEEDYSSKGSSLTLHGVNSLHGKFDKNRVEQVITNLISNAIKYGESKPIEVYVEDSGNQAIIKVADQGQGIKLEDQEKIFERFERINQTREVSGLGLGLWIVKRIVEQLNGTIHVESQGPGKGSVFIFKLPKNI